MNDVNNYIISCSTTGKSIGIFSARTELQAAAQFVREAGDVDVAALLSEIAIEQLDLDATVAALATQMVADDLECGDTSAWNVIAIRNAAYYAGIPASIATAVATHCYGLLFREYHATMAAGRRAA